MKDLIRGKIEIGPSDEYRLKVVFADVTIPDSSWICRTAMVPKSKGRFLHLGQDVVVTLRDNDDSQKYAIVEDLYLPV